MTELIFWFALILFALVKIVIIIAFFAAGWMGMSLLIKAYDKAKAEGDARD